MMEGEEFRDEEDAFVMDFDIGDIYLLYHCLQETIKMWPGAPARPYEEQQHLWDLRDNLYRCILDHKFHNM